MTTETFGAVMPLGLSNRPGAATSGRPYNVNVGAGLRAGPALIHLVRQHRDVPLGDFARLAVHHDAPALEQQRAIAERRDDAWIVADDDHRVAERAQLPVALFATCLEARVADGEDRSEERRVGKECRSRWSPY